MENRLKKRTIDLEKFQNGSRVMQMEIYRLVLSSDLHYLQTDANIQSSINLFYLR